jgi:hypothetical protein
MAKLKESECEMILKLAGDVIGDKGFIGTDYIITQFASQKTTTCTCANMTTITRSAHCVRPSSEPLPT